MAKSASGYVYGDEPDHYPKPQPPYGGPIVEGERCPICGSAMIRYCGIAVCLSATSDQPCTEVPE